MAERIPTAWMWAVDDVVYGLSIDLETLKLRWFVNAGCLCDWDDAETSQTITQYRARGVPGQIGAPPPDVLGEIDHSVSGLVADDTQ